MRIMFWTIFSAMSRPRHQIARSDGKRSVFFGGGLTQHVVTRFVNRWLSNKLLFHFGNIEIDKIETKIDAEKVSKIDCKIIRK